jgi:hypothetical protein
MGSPADQHQKRKVKVSIKRFPDTGEPPGDAALIPLRPLQRQRHVWLDYLTQFCVRSVVNQGFQCFVVVSEKSW